MQTVQIRKNRNLNLKQNFNANDNLKKSKSMGGFKSESNVGQ